MVNRWILGAVAALFSASGASASKVVVTVINNTDKPLTMRPISQNDKNTVIHAQPGVPQGLRAGERASFFVDPYVTNDVNFAAARYQGAGVSCAFLTKYVNTQVGHTRVPRWDHSAQGGLRCSSRIVSRDPRSHDWSVEFIIN
jgi:hypothetical protein